MQIFRNAKSFFRRIVDQPTLSLYSKRDYTSLNVYSDISYLGDYHAFKIKSIKEARFGRPRWVTCSLRKIGLNMRSDSIRKFKL